MHNPFAKYVGILLLCAVSMAEAALENGNSLKQKCGGAGITEGVCIGYIEGIADVLSSGTAVNGFRGCFPNDLMTGQAYDVVKTWLAQNPEKLHYSAPGLVAAALASAFPCK